VLNGLDLFSGIGGITIALREWVRPVCYCEIEPYAQGVLLSRMADGSLPSAPIWDDITTLKGKAIPKRIDIITGGFPCQDISVAGRGAGLEGERSGLFFEIMRLVDELSPRFLFLENVPAILARGGLRVTGEIASRGYDCRWCIVSAAEVGAWHKRDRWWLLAYSRCQSERATQNIRSFKQTTVAEDASDVCEQLSKAGNVADSKSQRIQGQRADRKQEPQSHDGERLSMCQGQGSEWWATEPDVVRIFPHGIPVKLDEIKLGEINDEDLRWLWEGVGAKEIWKQARGFDCLSKTEILRPFMHGEGAGEGIAVEISDPVKNKKIQERLLRVMRIEEKALHTSHRWKLEEQQYREFEDAVFALSYIFASSTGRLGRKEAETALHYLRSAILSAKSLFNTPITLQEAWRSLDSEWRKSLLLGVWNIEPPIDRVVSKLSKRTDRIKGLGNSVVPQSCREAFIRLSGIESDQ
jgi:DNA (cytosine-5)-methyltransferase 1